MISQEIQDAVQKVYREVDKTLSLPVIINVNPKATNKHTLESYLKGVNAKVEFIEISQTIHCNLTFWDIETISHFDEVESITLEKEVNIEDVIDKLRSDARIDEKVANETNI